MRSDLPLDDGRRALASAHFEWARKLARVFGRGRDLADEFESAAVWGLALAAASYEPELGTPFKSWARTAIKGEVLDVLRKRLAPRRGGRLRRRPLSDLAELPGGGPPPGAELEAREVFDRWLRTLPDDQADACRAMAEEGRPGDAARRLGIKDRQFRHRRRSAAARLEPRRRELQCSH